MNTRVNENGAVSLFIVIFTTLLVTIITVSFIRIMLSDQKLATAADLSQSAYDSAQSGVEDAKRALLYYQSECAAGRCTDALAMMNATACNGSLVGVLGNVSGQEVQVQQSLGDSSLQQAYTCVKIAMNTDDYVGTLVADDSKIIPLRGVSAFDTVRIQWFNASDLQAGSTNVDLPPLSADAPLVSQSNWTSASVPNRPSLMRAQLMQYGSGGFTLADLDGDTNTASNSNANTLFLFPSTIANSTKSFIGNTRKVASTPTQIHCNPSVSSGGYACSADITMPAPINGGDRTAFLRLSSIYKKSNFRVALLNGATPVQFNGVQPQVDSTGRANDLFRRVQSRVELVDSAFPYPEAAVDLSGNFCKDFLVTSATSDYANTCTP